MHQDYGKTIMRAGGGNTYFSYGCTHITRIFSICIIKCTKSNDRDMLDSTQHVMSMCGQCKKQKKKKKKNLPPVELSVLFFFFFL
jgi:hypothetical protein